MESLTLIRPVLVKVKVTEGYKKTAAAELQDAVRRVEVAYGKMESIIDLKKGDDWRQVLGVEVVLQDGIVTAIRQSGGKEPGNG